MNIGDSLSRNSPSSSVSASASVGGGGGQVRLGFQAASGSGDAAGASLEVGFLPDATDGGEADGSGASDETKTETPIALGNESDETKTDVPEDRPQQETETPKGEETKSNPKTETKTKKKKKRQSHDAKTQQKQHGEAESTAETPENVQEETGTKSETPGKPPHQEETGTKSETPEKPPHQEETGTKTETPEKPPHQEETGTKSETPGKPPHQEETGTKRETPGKPPHQETGIKSETPEKPPHQETGTKTETPKKQYQEETGTKTETPKKQHQDTKTDPPKKPHKEETGTKTETPRKEKAKRGSTTSTADDPDDDTVVSKKTEPDADADHDDPPSRGIRFLGIEFAPLNTPMRRRLQTLAVMQWLASITVLPVLCAGFICLLLLTPLAPFALAYIGWVLIFDRNSSQRGGRRWDRIRNWSLWRHYRDYFPIRLVKSAELDPAHNYLIGYHPHGIISCGAFCNFGTEATGFGRKFPGIRPYLLTLRLNFFWPLLRGYFLWAGLCDVSKPSIQWILGREGGGNAAIIVVGGAQEALDARPGNYRLTLLRRKGFARMALQTGAHLVPCFSFGENDLFRQAQNPPGSRVRAFQQFFKGAMGSSPPLFYGRGVFNYTFGLLPFRHEVITVVGAPISVAKSASPTPDEVDSLHQQYMQQLAELFDQHKGRYGVADDVHLEFV